MNHASDTRRSDDTRFGYFLLQARLDLAAGVPTWSGVMEDLSSGRKWAFQSAEDLGAVLRDWARTGIEARR